jgi:hypothetical protein
MTEPITMYKAHHWGRPRISEIQVEKVTAKTAMVIGSCGTRRENLLTGCEATFRTWEEARDWLMERCERNVQSARRELEQANGVYGNVKGWVKP